MEKIRIANSTDNNQNNKSLAMHFEKYEMEEIILEFDHKIKKKVIQIHVSGKNFTIGAQPIKIRIGQTFAKYVKISSNECEIDAILLEQPEENSYVDILWGDIDIIRHPKKVSTSEIKRIEDSTESYHSP